MTLTEEQKALFDALTQLQKKFVTHILKGKNQTQAYRKAGGKAKTSDSANVSANQIFNNLKVQAFIQSVQHETVNEAIMTYTEAMERLTLMGRTTIHDIATFGNYQIGEDEEGQPVFQASWKFKDSKNIKPEHLAAVAELSTGKDGLKIKLHDPKAAIKQLAEMRGWEAPKKAELTGANGGPIQTSNLTPDEAAEAYRKLMG
ncbi:terminase small subunit [Yersinia pseudotuberculosis]|uniref:terminase small subunit n=1 Tax=Yersinia pseudotuberculosis TaxID=633 RepID=UPI000DF88B73|nr:terminase small subunit [Yersinia pseudotuberculosis]MBO1550261.1 terminase small subunit [Yersinia pseudotuberculosis]MBO1570387.1 terminase small subunit [Yersinia pseudotuberculosis]MBO1585385.1 terminase small subunit [Yersinia pseudotuberculosis]MBO1634817.1 terminase small subunit [Yersinia pseudotuberculosis]SUQ17639.1 phage terminase small subunit [Yersinia pseudotuberculosis]